MIIEGALNYVQNSAGLFVDLTTGIAYSAVDLLKEPAVQAMLQIDPMHGQTEALISGISMGLLGLAGNLGSGFILGAVVTPLGLGILTGAFILNYTRSQNIEEALEHRRQFEAELKKAYKKETGADLEDAIAAAPDDFDDWPDSTEVEEKPNWVGDKIFALWGEFELPWRVFLMLLLLLLFLALRKRRKK